MFINYHEIRATINHVHSYTAHLYGVSRRAAEQVRDNLLIIRNEIYERIVISAHPKETNINIKNKPLNSFVRFVLHFNRNNVKIKNSKADSKLYIQGKSNKPTDLHLKQRAAGFIYSVIHPKENKIIIHNDEITPNITVFSDTDNQIIKISNKNLEPNITISGRTADGKLKVQNPNINAAAWYFMQLQMMTGSLIDYANQTLEDTGRKKVV